MRTSGAVIGLFLGAVLAATLAPPLFVAFPSRYLNDWFYVTPETALVCLVAALVLIPLIGLAGAWTQPDAPIRTGTTVATLAVVFAWATMVLPAAVVEACGELLRVASTGRVTEAAFRAVSAEAFVTLGWMPSVVSIVVLATGPALGAIGGVVFDLWQGSTSRQSRIVHRSSVPLMGLAAGVIGQALGGLVSHHVDATQLRMLGHPASWTDLVLLTMPTAAGGLFGVVLVAWAARDARLLLRKRMRVFGLTWIAAALGMPFVGLLLGLLLHPRSALTPWPWLVGLSAVFTAAISFFLAGRADVALEESPRSGADLLGEGLLGGTAIVSHLLLSSVGVLLGAAWVVLPYSRALALGAGEVAARPETLVTRVFMSHWAAESSVGLIAVGYLLAAVPTWLVVRAWIARQEAE